MKPPTVESDRRGNQTILPILRPGTTHLVSLTGAVANSAVLNANAVRVVSNVDCHIAFGSDQASAGSLLLPANVVEDWPIVSGTDVLSGIRDATNGILFITLYT